MKIKSQLLLLLITTSTAISAQNYGFLGRKNSISIQGIGYYNIWGLLGGSNYKLRTFPGIKAERTISRRGLVSVSYNQLTEKMNLTKNTEEYINTKSYLFLSGNPDNYAKSVSYFSNYDNEATLRNFLFGYHYYLPKRGGNAPLGLNIGFLWNLGRINWSKTNTVTYKDESKNNSYVFSNLDMRRVYLSSLGLSIGNSNIYFNRIKTDFQLGLLFNIDNSMTGKSLMKDAPVITQNAADIMRYRDMNKIFSWNYSFFNYSIGYLF